MINLATTSESGRQTAPFNRVHSMISHKAVMLYKGFKYSLSDPHYWLHQTPTQSLYWLNPWLASGVHPSEIRKVGRNAYLKDGAGLYVSRTITLREFHRLCRSGERLNYLIDDDYEALAKDITLPHKYRKRMGYFAARVLPVICASDQVSLFAASDMLAEKYGCAKIEPHWVEPSPRPRTKDRSEKMIRLAYLSTASHLCDFSALVKTWVPQINNLLIERGMVAEITHFLGWHVDRGLLPHVSNIRWKHRHALPWRIYRHEIPRVRYDAILYPLQSNPVNDARSSNKLREAEMLNVPIFRNVSDVVEWINSN